ncbi:MAG TPA: methionine synthase [Dehalococcoidia bacterium]|nr:methionine synthase [Dehalococcoidia bacterium]
MSKGLLTTTVGSFPKPDYVVRARNEFSLGRISRQELAEVELKATAEVVRLQDDIGLDILVDGEMYRGDMVAFFAGEPGGKTIDGMKLGGLVRSYGNRYYHKPVITGKLAWPGPMTLDMWRYAQSLTDKPVKGMLTGPYTMVDWAFDEHYGDRTQAVLDMAAVIHQEALELDKAGALYIQVDEPAATTRFDEMDLVSRGLSIVTQGLKAKTVTHSCYGDFARVFQQIVNLPVGQLDIETANSDYDLLELFRGKQFDKELAIGVLDVHSHRIETVEQVVAGIRRGLEVVPPERLYIDPDCGLKTRTWDEAAAKLRVMVQGVRQVRKELGID